MDCNESIKTPETQTAVTNKTQEPFLEWHTPASKPCARYVNIRSNVVVVILLFYPVLLFETF
jgi:hypothetical protein